MRVRCVRASACNACMGMHVACTNSEVYVCRWVCTRLARVPASIVDGELARLFAPSDAIALDSRFRSLFVLEDVWGASNEMILAADRRYDTALFF